MTNATARVLLALTISCAATIASGDLSVQASCPELTASAGNSGPVCANSPVTLYGSSNQSGVTWSWTGSHTWFSTEQNPTAPGAGPYFLTVTNSDGCQAFANTTVEQVTPPPMTLSGVSAACGGEVVMVTLNDSASFSDLSWDFNAGTILSGQGTPSIQVQVDNLNNSTAALYLHGKHVATGCTTLGSHPIRVQPRYSAEVTTPSSACPNATITASVPSNPVHNIRWQITRGVITSERSETIQFVPDGTGDILLTATVYNGYGTCDSTDMAVIALSGPTASVDADLALCAGDSIAIPVALSGNPPFTITWSDGMVQSGITTTQSSRTVAPLETTVYSVTAVSDSLCAGSATGSAVVTVGNEPEILTPPQNAVIPRGTKTTLSVEASGAELAFHWYEGQVGDRSHLVSAGTSPEFETPVLQHTTRYWVEVIGACGSEESSAATVAVTGRQRATRH